MAGFEVDTSSYPRPAQQKSLLDTVGQFQQLESQSLTISKQKLDQMNTQFGLMNNELSTLANDPTITKPKAAERLTTFSKTLGLKPEVTQHMINELQTAPDVKTFAETALKRGMSLQEKLNNQYGVNGYYQSGQTNQPVRTSPLIEGGRPIATDKPYQVQVPPGTPTFDAENRPTFQGPTPAVTAPGTVAGPGGPSGPLPVQRVPTQAIKPPPTENPLPVAPRGDTGTTPDWVSPNSVVQNRYPAPSGPAAGQPPGFSEGLAQRTADQEIASKRMFAAKPALEALKLMKQPGFLSGPLTEQFTNVVAALKSTGLVNIANENDPTAIRQEAAKYLAQYVSGSPIAARSDAAQALTEASSPNPKVQILPALVKLTEDAVALDRLHSAMPNAFKGKDFSSYGQHKATFPQSHDARAFKLDYMDNPGKLVKEMAEKETSKDPKAKADAAKFFKSLRLAKEQGFYN